MYENDNFSGYETGDENTTGTFSGVSAAGSANGYTTYQMGGSTGSNTEPKNPKAWWLFPKSYGKCQSWTFLRTVCRHRVLCSTAGHRDA